MTSLTMLAPSITGWPILVAVFLLAQQHAFDSMLEPT